MLFGSTSVNPPSRFVSEIPSHLLEERVEEERPSFLSAMSRPKRSRYGSSALFAKRGGIRREPDDTFDVSDLPKSSISKRKPSASTGPKETDLRPGDSVEHPDFGGGVVVAIAGTIATIAFRKSGVKKLMLGTAPLRKV